MEQEPRTMPRFWIRGLVPGVLIGVGLLHSAVGFASGRALLAEIAREGLWNTVVPGSEPLTRPLLLWFLVGGFFLLMLGHLAIWVERHVRRPLPSALGIELLVFAITLGVVSGGAVPAWLFAASGVYIVIVAKSARRQGP
ncbi:MAG: hypothetical protein HYX75_16825 [Acidobacteria bacterium]|nr:hypothetical protein [Acidobacteriota bacterium]